MNKVTKVLTVELFFVEQAKYWALTVGKNHYHCKNGSKIQMLFDYLKNQN